MADRASPRRWMGRGRWMMQALALAAVGTLPAASCMPNRVPGPRCFAVLTADTVRHPDHPTAVWLLDEPHTADDPLRLRLRLPAASTPAPGRYWQPGDTVHIHVMGGMWGQHFWLRRTADGYAGRYEHRTDFGRAPAYEISLRPIACGSREWDGGGRVVSHNETSM